MGPMVIVLWRPSNLDKIYTFHTHIYNDTIMAVYVGPNPYNTKKVVI